MPVSFRIILSIQSSVITLVLKGFGLFCRAHTSPQSTSILYLKTERYIMRQINGHISNQLHGRVGKIQIRDVDTMLGSRWVCATHLGLTLIQHWINVSCLLGMYTSSTLYSLIYCVNISFCVKNKYRHFFARTMFGECRLDVGPAFTHHWVNYRVAGVTV